MKTAEKQKMCSNCHGRIPSEAETCLYCGQEQADLPTQDTEIQTNLFEQQSLQDSLTSLYSPPYGSKRSSAPFIETPAPVARKPKEPKISLPAEESMEEEENTSPSKGSFSSILLFLLGGNLFTLGLLQFFFSTNNRLILEWQTDSWYLYCLAAVPLLFVAYRLASKLQK